ncbi:MAG: DUF2007 domain-containing protein [Bacteroidota bacterium]|nr:DUF2007 domain-containing protein [Bacteroidota bacterium]
MNHTIVYTSAHVYEIDTVREAFEKAGVPFYVQTENLAGVRAAFPASPASGFGTRWHVYVPENAVPHAEKILSELHVSVGSDTTPFPVVSPADFKRYFWKALLFISPLIALMAYVLYKAATR